MAIFYDFATNFLSLSPGHVQQDWEKGYSFSEATCWNCGGEFTLERKTYEGYQEFKPCWTCAAVGVLPTSDWHIGAQLDWFINPQDYNIRFFNGEINIWEPF